MVISHYYWHLMWSRMAISQVYWHVVVKNVNFTCNYWHLVVKNSNFTSLLTSCGQEWQIHITTDILWSRMAISQVYLTSCGQEMAISHFYWHVHDQEWQFHIVYSHLMVKNGNITLVMTCSGQEWQFHMYYWHLVVKNGIFHISTDM